MERKRQKMERMRVRKTERKTERKSETERKIEIMRVRQRDGKTK